MVTASATRDDTVPNIDDLFWGTISYDGTDYIRSYAAEGYNYRLTVLPTGQYLKNGKTYKFSLGGITGYYYGVQMFVATESGLTFEPVERVETKMYGISSRLVDTGWITEDYIYTAGQDNLIIAVNFKNSTDSGMTDSDKATLLENFSIEVV